MKTKRAIDMYIAEVEANLSYATLRSYRGRLVKLAERLGGKKVAKLSEGKITEWIDDLTHWPDGRSKAPDTIRLTLIAWEQFQKFCIRQELIPEPIYKPEKKPGGRKRTRIPTALEQARIFREALRRGKREFAQIFHCLRLCGARPGELAKADISHFDRERNLISLKEHKTAKKTQMAREIGVGRTMRRVMDRCIGTRDVGPIFLDEKLTRWKPEKLSRTYRKLRDRLGLSRELVLYCARHEHGTNACRTHGIHAAQHSLGHRDIQTTQRYVHPDSLMLAGYQDAM